MCDWLSELNWLKVINGLLSLAILVMNGVYAIWGLFLTKSNSSKREDLAEYISTLERYANIVSYSDSVLVPLKIIVLLLVKRCCHIKICEHSSSDDDDGYDAEKPKRAAVEYNARGTKIKTYQAGSSTS